MAQPQVQTVSVAFSFLTTLFSATEQSVYLSSLPNLRDDPSEPPERHVSTREAATVDAFLHKWDRRGRGLFYCVGTLRAGAKRNKDNVVETAFLWCDIDFKSVDADQADIRAALRTLRYPPSIIVRSGNGLHCYWLLKEPLDAQADRDRIEAALRQLADLVAGDLQVCEVSRLMRLPGSHNTKDGAWIEVAVEPWSGDVRRYELDDLEEWLSETAPVLKRKGVATLGEAMRTGPRETNPYLEHAKEHGYKPPLDVEQALADMTFGNIHATQLSVSASLLNGGREVDEVVNILLDATASAAGDLGTRWNWTRERKALVKMCETWLAKHPQQPRTIDETIERRMEGARNAVGINDPAGSASSTVVNLGDVRKARSRKAQAGGAQHILLAETLLAVIEERGEAVLFTNEGSYRYLDRIWRLQTDAAMSSWLNTSIQTAARALSIEINTKLRNEARNWIMSHDDLWHTDVPWDAHGQVPTRSGLVNPRTGTLTPASPDHYCTWRIDCDYNPDAICPLWLQMVSDVFSDRDAETLALHVQLLQEMLGAGLIDRRPKALQKALVIEGGSNTGKSGLLDVMGGLYSDNCNATPLDMLSGPHALMPFARRVPWVLHEAFDQRWHMSNVVKALISGDDIQINVKGGPQYTHRFTAPIFWGTNHPPQFKEATAAITNRIVVIKCRREFDPHVPVGVAVEAKQQGYSKPSDLVLALELPGLLAWAVAGLRAALVRGNFVLPDEAQAAARDIRRDANYMLAFREACLDYDPDNRVSVPDLSIAVASWWLEHKGDDARAPSSDSIGRTMRALGDSKIAMDRLELRDNARRYYAGVRLNAEGMRHWHNAVASEAFVFQGRKASTSDSNADPNSAIPVAWVTRASVVTMRVSHGVSSHPQRSPDGSSTQPDDAADKPRF